jgi:sugar/nucleoside kinase (ribokinase family)
MNPVIGIGNALVDILVRLPDDQVLAIAGFPKGSMQLIDQAGADALLLQLQQLQTELAAGGSAANTINGLARLGLDTRFVGKIGNDSFGKAFEDDQIANRIKPILLRSEHPSGRAVALISPDSERTFGTFLGAAMHLKASDLSHDIFDTCSILHLEGYLIINKELIFSAAEMAKQLGLRISLDLASFNVVSDNLDTLREFIPHYVDILFANEEEARAYTGLSPEAALDAMAREVDIAVVKLGAQGSILRRGRELARVPAIKANPVDTTGAGDLYASGFIYGLLNELSLDQSAQIASLLAGKVIEVFGSKMSEERWLEIRRDVLEIEQMPLSF